MWKRGLTLLTPITKRWTKEQVEKNDKAEAAMIFSNFSVADKGITRQLVCTLNMEHPDYEQNAKLIEAAPKLLELFKQIYDVTEGEWDTIVIDKKMFLGIEDLAKNLIGK